MTINPYESPRVADKVPPPERESPLVRSIARIGVTSLGGAAGVVFSSQVGVAILDAPPVSPERALALTFAMALSGILGAVAALWLWKRFGRWN